MDKLQIESAEGGVVFKVKVVPGSSRTGVSNVLNGTLKIKVSAPAEKGKANRCLLEFLSKQLGVKQNAIRIISGKTKPIKSLQVLGLSTKQLLKKLNL